MSRGGIYEGPGGKKLFGDGREVSPLSDAHPVARRLVNSGMSFSQIHEAGVLQFGFAWLGANRAAVEAFQYCGVSVLPAKTKKALSLAVFRVLEGLQLEDKGKPRKAE